MPGLLAPNTTAALLVQPVFQFAPAQSANAPTEASVESWVRDLAHQLRVAQPRIEWDSQLPAISQVWRVCKSSFSRWAQLDRRMHTLHLNSTMLRDLDPNMVLLVLAHITSHMGKEEPEWVHDLRAMDLTGQQNARMNPATVALIAHNAQSRARALKFRCGAAVVDYGFEVAADADDDGDSHFVFRASPYQKYP